MRATRIHFVLAMTLAWSFVGCVGGSDPGAGTSTGGSGAQGNGGGHGGEDDGGDNDGGAGASDSGAGDDGGPGGEDDGEDAPPEGSGDDGDPALIADLDACQDSLEECSYDESETACSSLKTPAIPLSDGGEWGDVVLEQGPYGSYVEWNAGAGFPNEVSSLESSCDDAESPEEEPQRPQSVSDDITDLRGQDLGLYTLFRPACMKEGETYPVILWGNGTCSPSGGYASLLATVASHGFVVIAPNSRWTDGEVMLKALDLAAAMNGDPESLFYAKLDLENVGAMGHSQGASATASAAAADERIDAVILWNGGGTSENRPFLVVSGDQDIGGITAERLDQAVAGSSQPGAWLYYHQILETGGVSTGHLTLMEQPERVTEVTVAWWKYMLQDDENARTMFAGDDCGLCGREEELEFGQHNLP